MNRIFSANLLDVPHVLSQIEWILAVVLTVVASKHLSVQLPFGHLPFWLIPLADSFICHHR
jgi:hypothetical protein